MVLNNYLEKEHFLRMGMKRYNMTVKRELKMHELMFRLSKNSYNFFFKYIIHFEKTKAFSLAEFLK